MGTQTTEIIETELPAEASPGTPGEPEKSGKPGLVSLFVTVAILNLVLTSGLLYLYDGYVVPRVVAVDIKGFIERQRDLYVSKKINDEQLKANLDAMEHRIKSMPKNVVMITADVVVGEHAETVEP
ncbi:MAG: hypothetical protein PHU49_04415 [Syntrophorhabdaceae bacterium]|nr:hypothetical protein [Syntrophorhabdaceae bacterium]MDD5243239.1 hypothetical protein [Syntrophorhabdaceae bacterium]